MKKSVLALAVLGAFAGAASAQSSVTMFGVVDLNLMSVDNDERTYSMGTDGMSSSRLGFRGVEDLGGGLKAGFWLEMGLAADTGDGTATWGNGSRDTNALVFNRRSTVSLSNQWGELRLGRDYTATFWSWTVFDPFGTNGVGSATNLALGQDLSTALAGTTYGTLVRANNMVQYILPAGVFGPGLYGQLQMAAGEGAPATVLGWPYRLRRRAVRHRRRLRLDRLPGPRVQRRPDQLEHRWFVELRFHEAVGLLQLDRSRRQWQQGVA